MTEPQSTTDAGLPSAPDLPPDPEAEERSEDPLSEQVAKTDAALLAWRSESLKRRASWEAARARAEAEMYQQRRKVLGFGAATLLAAALVLVGVSVAVHSYRTGADARAAEDRVHAPRPPLPRIAAPEGVEIPPEVPPPASLPPSAPPIDLQPGSVRVWNQGGHVWAAFATTEKGPVGFQYLDGDRRAVLEPMGCEDPDVDGVRRCTAGRSRTRLSRAIAEGAAPGTWTIQACGAVGCADLGTFPAH